MPVERRRSPAPNDFPNSQAEKTWWETELMLDAAPPTGALQWHDMYDVWQGTYEDCIKQGESPDSARGITWNSFGFFVLERIADLEIEAEHYNFKHVKLTQISRELSILSSWQKIIGDALDQKSANFNGDPPNPYLPLKDNFPLALVEPGNPNSPIFAHLQALHIAADREIIPFELKNAILGHAIRDKGFLEHSIDAWNDQINSVADLKGQDPEVIRTLHETGYIILALTMATSWGVEKDAGIRLNQFGEYLPRLRNQPNALIGLLNADVLEARTESFVKKHGLSEEREYAITDLAIRRAEKIRVIGNSLFDQKVSSSYTAEVAGYRHLDFGAVVVWTPKANYWIGNMIISQEGHNPPRSHTPLVRLVNAATPQQAIVGFLDYMGQHIELINLPYQVKLSSTNIKRALKFLNEQRVIYQVHVSQPSDSDSTQ